MNTEDSRYNEILVLFEQLTPEDAAKALEYAESLIEQHKDKNAV